MDWDEVDESSSSERGPARERWRDSRADLRPGRKGLEERLEGWVSRGRDLVDGVSGARPGTRPPARSAERPGAGGRGGFDGLGRWVEGRLDWLLDDRDDWREPWQEAPRAPAEDPDPEPSPPRRSRPPLEAISRRRAPAAAPASAPAPGSGISRPDRDWPEEEVFSVPRWRREEPPAPRPANPLADPPPAPAPGRPLPRSTRRR
jgi:hypothetical protein